MAVGYDGGANGGSVEARGGALAILGHGVLGRPWLQLSGDLAELKG